MVCFPILFWSENFGKYQRGRGIVCQYYIFVLLVSPSLVTTTGHAPTCLGPSHHRVRVTSWVPPHQQQCRHRVPGTGHPAVACVAISTENVWCEDRDYYALHIQSGFRLHLIPAVWGMEFPSHTGADKALCVPGYSRNLWVWGIGKHAGFEDSSEAFTELSTPTLCCHPAGFSFCGGWEGGVGRRSEPEPMEMLLNFLYWQTFSWYFIVIFH